MGGPLTNHNLVSRYSEAPMDPSPKTEVFNHKRGREAGGVSSISGITGS